MAADLIFTALLLILPTVLWLVPKTRRNNGNWLIAMKTFPLGIIAAFWVGELLGKIARIISERQEREFEFPFGMGLAISLAAGFLVIILGGLFIKRRFGTEKKYNPGPSVLLFLLFLLPSLFCLLIITYACNLMESDYKGKWQNIWLPREGNTGIAFQERSIHPFLAEYDYRLRFSRDGELTSQLLLTNTGGLTHFNVYRLKDGRLMFRDKMWDYLVDVQGPECRVFRLETFEEKLYAARIPNVEIDSWSFVPVRKDDGFVMEMGGQTVPAEDVTGILDDMEYYGCIQDRFYPAEQKPEEKITKMFEQEKSEGVLYY